MERCNDNDLSWNENSALRLQYAKTLKLSALQCRYWKEAQEGSVPLSARIAAYKEDEGDTWPSDPRKVASASHLALQGQAVATAAAEKFEQLCAEVEAASSVDQLSCVRW